ncbi:MAG: uracil phosphoribosyltransferase [Verrucomicrobia bacterium]|nr:uracil phosphoribosyltransferase [Verrucomicrobiota bacterium]
MAGVILTASMSDLIDVNHPLLDRSLTILRDRRTSTGEFRQHASIVSHILLTEATRQLRTTPVTIATPLAEVQGSQLDEQVVVVPVLRAGLAMLLAIQDMLPSVSVGFVGLERDEETAVAREYYQKLPPLSDTHQVFVLDPMLATGGSLDDTVDILIRKGCRNITLVCIVAAPEGITHIRKKHPGVTMVIAAIDDHLNDQKFIVPGLGDFGDRYFGT